MFFHLPSEVVTFIVKKKNQYYNSELDITLIILQDSKNIIQLLIHLYKSFVVVVVCFQNYTERGVIMPSGWNIGSSV